MLVLLIKIVRQTVLVLNVLLVACYYQAMAKGNMSYKMQNASAIVCVSHITLLDNGSAYEFQNLSCVQYDEQGHEKVLMTKKPGQMTMKQEKRGQADIFRRIQMLVAASCLRKSEDAVKHRNGENTKSPKEVGNGYRKVGSGKDTMYLKRHDNITSWDEAASVCHSENARLAKPDTKKKMKEIQKHMSDPNDQFKKFYMWIGLRVRNNSFTWVDGSPLSFNDWYYGPPQPIDDHCGALVWFVLKGVHWTDYGCEKRNGFLCERKKM